MKLKKLTVFSAHFRFLNLLLMAALLLPSSGWAQSLDGEPEVFDDKTTSEFGFHMGKVLPNQIPGVTEIAPQWGVRTGFRLTNTTFVEVGGLSGKGEGVEWSNFHVSLRASVPIETLVGLVFIGGDVHYLGAEGREKKFFGGGHVGGGIMSHIADAVWFRMDMKFNVNPGTSLYIGAGFQFRLGGGSS